MIAIDSQERLLSGDRIFFSDHNDFAFVLEGATLSIYDIGIN
jgi:hypothetical protein